MENEIHSNNCAQRFDPISTDHCSVVYLGFLRRFKVAFINFKFWKTVAGPFEYFFVLWNSSKKKTSFQDVGFPSHSPHFPQSISRSLFCYNRKL